MSNITLMWDADGSIESFSIYRAEQSMDPSNLPTPIATGISEKTYVDNNVVEDKTYFYRVASVKGGKQKISDEIRIKATPGYINKFYNINGLTLIKCNQSALKFKENGGLLFSVNQSSSETIKLDDSPVLQDFTAEFDYTQLSGTETWANLAFVFRTNHWETGDNGSSAYSLFFTKSIACLVRGTDSSTASETWLTRFSFNFALNQKYHIKIKAESALFTLFIDDIEIGTWNDTAQLKKGQFGFRSWDSSQKLSTLIENLVIKEN